MVLYGVSVGPGDPEDMTVKAVRTLEKCRVIAVPRTGGERSLALSVAEKAADLQGKEIVFIDLPMTRDSVKLSAAWEKAAGVLTGILEREDAAMLCLGDISVYSTFSYIGGLVAGAGFEVRWCPGVSSFCAGAAALGTELVSGSEVMTVIPYSSPELGQLLDRAGTKIVMKSGRNACKLKALLREKGLLGSTAAVINVGLEGEKLLFGEDIPEEPGYFALFIIKDSI